MFLYYAVSCYVLILCCEVLCSDIMLGGAMFSMLCYVFYVVL